MPDDQDTNLRNNGVAPNSDTPGDQVERAVPEVPSGSSTSFSASESTSSYNSPEQPPASEATFVSTPGMESEPNTASVPGFGAAVPAQAAGPAMNGQLPSPASQPSGSGKKKLIIGGIIAGALVLLGGGSVLAYSMYQNPEKVVLDGFVNTLSSKVSSADGKVTYKSNIVDLTVEIKGKTDQKVVNGTINVSANVKASDLTLEGSADFAAESNGNGYIKLNNVDELLEEAVDSFVDSQAEQYKTYGMAMTPQQLADAKKQAREAYQPIIDKINNKWIKFAADENSETSKDQKCISDAYKKLQSDGNVRNELANAYKDNKFVKIKEELGLKDGSYGYVLDFDKDKSKAFGDALEKTTLVKELKKCTGDTDSTDSLDSTSSDSSSDPRIEVWVSQWSHQITKMVIAGKSDGVNKDDIAITLELGYGAVSGLTVPKDAVDSKEIEKEMQGLMMGGSSATSASVSI